MNNMFDFAKKYVALQIVILLVMVGTAATVYFLASRLASNMASGFSMVESDHHAQMATYSTALRRSSSEQLAARSRCEILSTVDRKRCVVEAMGVEIRANKSARLLYKEGKQQTDATGNGSKVVDAADNAADNAATKTTDSVPVTARRSTKRALPHNIDLALYRVHRQASE